MVITESRHTLADELPAWTGAALDRLGTAARECGGVAAAPFVVYHAEVSTQSGGPAEACVPVADEAAARAWAGRQGRGRATTGVRVEPAARPAYVRITKAQVAHPQILAAFEAVEEWLGRQGLEPAGPGDLLRRLGGGGSRGFGVRRGVPGARPLRSARPRWGRARPSPLGEDGVWSRGLLGGACAVVFVGTRVRDEPLTP